MNYIFGGSAKNLVEFEWPWKVKITQILKSYIPLVIFLDYLFPFKH